MKKITIVANQHNFFLVVKVNFDPSKIINGKFFSCPKEAKAAFDEKEGCDDGEIPTLFERDGSIFITGANTLTGDPEDANASVEDIINNYVF
jgi:hypothetical protein